MTHATRAAANKTLLSEQPRKNVCVFLMCRMIWLTWPLQWINSDLTQHLALGRWNSNVEEHFHVVITAEECFASYGEAGRSSLNTDLFEGNPAQECMFLSQSTVGHEDRVDHKSIYWRSEEIRNMRKTKSLSYMIILRDSLLSLSLFSFGLILKTRLGLQERRGHRTSPDVAWASWRAGGLGHNSSNQKSVYCVDTV